MKNCLGCDLIDSLRLVTGWGTDEKSVIAILAHRDAAHRQQIRLAYEERYKEDLIKRLESELSGDFEVNPPPPQQPKSVLATGASLISFFFSRKMGERRDLLVLRRSSHGDG